MPGDPKESELWFRLTTHDRDDAMPPKDSIMMVLTEEQKELVRRWIELGAGSEAHWAFVALEHPAVPQVNGQGVNVDQERQWSLTDIVGASSAAFASLLEEVLQDPKAMADAALSHREAALDRVRKHMPEKHGEEIHALLARANRAELEDAIGGFGSGLVPVYTYWPVLNASADPNAKPSEFADGGNLENTGIASLLAYGDIDGVIAFVNSSTPLEGGSMGVIDPATGKEIPTPESWSMSSCCSCSGISPMIRSMDMWHTLGRLPVTIRGVKSSILRTSRPCFRGCGIHRTVTSRP